MGGRLSLSTVLLRNKVVFSLKEVEAAFRFRQEIEKRAILTLLRLKVDFLACLRWYS